MRTLFVTEVLSGQNFKRRLSNEAASFIAALGVQRHVDHRRADEAAALLSVALQHWRRRLTLTGGPVRQGVKGSGLVEGQSFGLEFPATTKMRSDTFADEY